MPNHAATVFCTATLLPQPLIFRHCKRTRMTEKPHYQLVKTATINRQPSPNAEPKPQPLRSPLEKEKWGSRPLSSKKLK
jgi:hypothetical protein